MFQLRRLWECDVTVSYVDDTGDPATVEGNPVWSSADTAVLNVVPTADPMVVARPLTTCTSSVATTGTTPAPRSASASTLSWVISPTAPKAWIVTAGSSRFWMRSVMVDDNIGRPEPTKRGGGRCKS